MNRIYHILIRTYQRGTDAVEEIQERTVEEKERTVEELEGIRIDLWGA